MFPAGSGVYTPTGDLNVDSRFRSRNFEHFVDHHILGISRRLSAVLFSVRGDAVKALSPA